MHFKVLSVNVDQLLTTASMFSAKLMWVGGDSISKWVITLANSFWYGCCSPTGDQKALELPVKEAKAADHGVEVPTTPEPDPCRLSEALTEGPAVDQALFPSTNSDWGSKGSRKPKEVTLKSREPTRVQTFASDVVVAQVEVTIEVLSELRR